MRRNLGILSFCAAMAAGEGLGACFPTMGALLPAVAILLAFTILIGYGAGWRFWPHLAVALCALMLFQASTMNRESSFRASPWMRNARHPTKMAEPTVKGGNLTVRIRRDLSRRVGIGLDHVPEIANLNRAILIGERRQMPRETRSMFVDAGTIHIFAISGLHIMIIAKTLMVMLALLFIPPRIAGLVAMPILWLYVAVIGFPPSAIRACSMASINFLAIACWRKPDLLRSWALTFIGVHLVKPECIADVGSLMSFAVMLAIALATTLPNLPRNGIRATLCISFAAWLAGMPIAAHVFGRITPAGLLTNLVLIPAAEITVVSGVVGTLASFVSETLAAHFNNLAALLTMAMTEISRGVAMLPGANFSIPSWPLWECLAFYAAIAMMMWLVYRIRSRRCL